MRLIRTDLPHNALAVQLDPNTVVVDRRLSQAQVTVAVTALAGGVALLIDRISLIATG